MSSELQSEPMAPKGYADFLMEVKTQIRQRQLQALRAVNSELLALYWWLGENISQRQNKLGWGKSVVENLARDLQAEFPGRNGFSAPNLWFMRQFYNEYRDKQKLQPLVREISWSKNLLIMTRCKDYFIDLLLFHRRLRCLVAIELKIGDFKPEHKGQIEFYLDTLDQQHRLEGENPPIGIMICRSKTKTMVEYALRTASHALGIATYTVTPQLPASYQADLPSPEQIAARLQGWTGRDGLALDVNDGDLDEVQP
jgi:predicted nuclease of restriction endonuclease-like (RecB) superfamily